MQITKDTLGVYPESELCALSGVTHCITFYDWEKPIDAEWMDKIIEMFAEFGQVIDEGTGNLGAQHSHGSFRRVKKRLAGFLSGIYGNVGQNFDIRLRSVANYKSDAFFPCDMEIVFNSHRFGNKGGMLAVRENLIGSSKLLVEKVGEKLFSLTGATYAGVFDFPTMFGPECYQASVSAVPRGMDTFINEAYKKRITKFRDNRGHGFLTNQGYLREVYPINFLLETHLKMPFHNQSLSEYMQRVGTLERIHDKNMYRWDIPLGILDDVRQEFESSGLILSSALPPLAKNK